jgi:ADP-heptose:LPS heptosyltransferase
MPVNRVRLLKTVDALVGRFAAFFACLIPLAPSKSGQIDSILIIRPGGIGDAVLLVPAILAIRSKYPSAKICILAERRNSAVFNLCPEVDQVLRYDLPLELFTAVRGYYDLVIDTEQWHRLSAVVARLTRAPLLVGFGTNRRRRMLTHAMPYCHDDYEAESFLRLLEPLGIEMQGNQGRFLTIPEDGVKAAGSLLVPLAGKPFVAIFPGASIPERRWGGERFRQLAENLSAAGYPVVVVGGKVDQAQGETITADGRLGLNLAGRLSLAGSAAVIEQCRLLVSGDSGLLHIGVGLGRPTVSLFGPGRAAKWAPQGECHVVINRGLACSPCTTFGSTPPCPDDARCMKDIRVDQVANQVTSLLARLGQA